MDETRPEPHQATLREPASEPVDQPLYGRTRERHRLTQFLDVAAEDGACIAVRGEPGVGKTRMLTDVVRHAHNQGFVVLDAAGAEFEADLTYATLNHLLLPVLAHRGGIEPVLRQSLDIALGLGNGSPPSPLLVCTAVLALAKVVSAEGPLLIAIDDFQWVDQGSALIIQLLSRRVTGTRIGLITTERDTSETPLMPSFDILELTPLGANDALQLVAGSHPGLPGHVRERLLTEARGNPLALLELSETAQRLAESQGYVPASLPLSRRLRSSFADRISALDDAARHALVITALEGHAGTDALTNLGIPVAALEPAEHARIVTIDSNTFSVRFRHPLTRAAVIDHASAEELRRAHLLLADASADPDRAAWHRAEASLGPDDSVADAMETVARRALDRGDIGAAVKALGRAATLTTSHLRRKHRLAEAAYLGADITGDRTAILKLQADRRNSASDTQTLHEVAALAYDMMERDGTTHAAHRLLVSALDSSEHRTAGDDPATLAAMGALLVICVWSGEPDHWADFERLLSGLTPAPPELMLVESRTFGDTARSGAAFRTRLLNLIDSQASERNPGRLFRINSASIYMDLLGSCGPVAHTLLRDSRRTGAVRASIISAMHVCVEAFQAGRWDEADRIADLGLEMCDRNGYGFTRWYFQHQKGMLAAARGATAEAGEWSDLQTATTAERQAGNAERIAFQVRALAASSVGDWEAAYRHASALNPPGEFAPFRPHALWVAYDLVEAAVRTGRTAEASAHVRAMLEGDIAAISPRMSMLTDASSGLISQGAEATVCFERALATEGSEGWPFDRARVQLAYGEKLRRDLEAVQARGHLHEALRVFEELGATPWAERAREELHAARDPEHRLMSVSSRGLTPQERVIAELAASGLSNKEIGARLFLSPRTVSGHLYRVFPKLGITARAGLRDALAEEDGSYANVSVA